MTDSERQSGHSDADSGGSHRPSARLSDNRFQSCMALPAGGRRRLPVRIQTCAQPRGTFVNPAARLQRVQMDRRCVALAIFLCQAFAAASGNYALLDADGDHSRAKRRGFLAKCQITAAENGLDPHDNAHKNAHAEFAYRDTVDALIDNTHGACMRQMRKGRTGFRMLPDPCDRVEIRRHTQRVLPPKWRRHSRTTLAAVSTR